jgi:predicted amidohydrolase
VRERVVVGIAQWLPAPADGAGNLRTALGHVAALAARGCELVVLPELWPSGFEWQTLAADVRATAEPLDGPRLAALAAAARAAGAWLVAGSVPELDGDDVYNTALVLDPSGALRATHRKAHLYTPLREEQALARGDDLVVVDTDIAGPLGLATCFDGDFPEVARALRDAGARVVVMPAAYEHAAETWWDRLYPAHALANGQWWIQANQCGSTASGTFLGASRVIDPHGAVVAEAPRAGEGETPPPHLLVAELALRAEVERWDAASAVLYTRRRPALPVRRA